MRRVPIDQLFKNQLELTLLCSLSLCRLALSSLPLISRERTTWRRIPYPDRVSFLRSKPLKSFDLSWWVFHSTEFPPLCYHTYSRSYRQGSSSRAQRSNCGKQNFTFRALVSHQRLSRHYPRVRRPGRKVHGPRGVRSRNSGG